jgi:hypothetical protein
MLWYSQQAMEWLELPVELWPEAERLYLLELPLTTQQIQ